MTLNIAFVELPASIQLSFDTDCEMPVDFGSVIAAPEAEQYSGDYEVTPSDTGTVLPTAHKQLSDDVTVHPIPYFCVSNPAGGDPVYIGGEAEIS